MTECRNSNKNGLAPYKLIVHDTCMCGFHAMGHLDSHSNSSTSDCSCDLLGTKPHFVMESQSVQSVVP